MFDRSYFESPNGHGYVNYKERELPDPGIADYLSGYDNILIIGCAYGFTVKRLQEKGVNATGMDISEYAVENAVSDVFQGDARVSSDYRGQYDTIVTEFVLSLYDGDDAERICKNARERADKRIHFVTHPDHRDGQSLDSYEHLDPDAEWYKR